MFGSNFTKNCKITKVEAGASAGTSTLTSDGVDMQGWTGVVFVGSVATQAANNIAHCEQGADNSSDWEDLEGTANTTGDDADSFCIDIYRPTDRYVRCVLARGTSTAAGDIYAIQYGPTRKLPASQGATIDAENFASPDEGTP